MSSLYYPTCKYGTISLPSICHISQVHAVTISINEKPFIVLVYAISRAIYCCRSPQGIWHRLVVRVSDTGRQFFAPGYKMFQHGTSKWWLLLCGLYITVMNDVVIGSHCVRFFIYIKLVLFVTPIMCVKLLVERIQGCVW